MTSRKQVSGGAAVILGLLSLGATCGIKGIFPAPNVAQGEIILKDVQGKGCAGAWSTPKIKAKSTFFVIWSVYDGCSGAATKRKVTLRNFKLISAATTSKPIICYSSLGDYFGKEITGDGKIICKVNPISSKERHSYAIYIDDTEAVDPELEIDTY